MDKDTRQQETSMVKVGRLRVAGTLSISEKARGIVLCIDESGCSLLDARHRAVASAFSDADIATLLIDLLTVPASMPTKADASDSRKAMYRRDPFADGIKRYFGQPRVLLF